MFICEEFELEIIIMKYIMFEIEVCVLHNLEIANLCFTILILRFLSCVTKKT